MRLVGPTVSGWTHSDCICAWPYNYLVVGTKQNENIYDKMKRIKKQLLKVESELVEGKKLINEKKHEMEKADTKLKKNNKKWALRTIKKAVEDLEHHRDRLEDLAAKENSAKS